MGDRCTGHCCQRFYLPYSPWELDDIARKVVARAAFTKAWCETLPALDLDDRSTWETPLVPIPAELTGPNVEDIVQIAGMVEFIAFEDGGHWYRCKNLRDDGNCGIYSQRPRMCRDYPYGRACGFVACTWTAARKGAVASHRHLLMVRGESLTVHLRVLQDRGLDIAERASSPDA